MRRVHHRGGRGGNPLAPRPAVAGGFRAGRDRLAAGRRGAAVDPAQDAASPAHPGRARRRGIGQRRHRAHPLSVRGRRGERRRVLVRSGGGNVRRHRRRRNPLGYRRRLADAAPAALGAQSAGRDHALCADAVSRLLAARASRRLGRARNRHCRTLHQLERPSPDQRRHQAARNFLLELLHLPGRGPGVPRHRPAGAHADGPHRTLSGVRARRLRRRRQRRRDRCPVRVDVSRHLCAALALRLVAAQGSIAAMAVAVRACLHRRARHRLARRRTRDPVRKCRRVPVSRPATSSCS